MNMSEQTKKIEASFGKWLKEQRTAKKITLEALSEKTSIRPAVLQAIEAEAHEQLPAKTYTVGFIRLFAREVGLDPDEVVRRYHLHLDSEADEKKRPNWDHTYETYTDSGQPVRWLFLLLAGVALVLVAWWSYAWLWPQLSELMPAKWQIGSVQSEGDNPKSENDSATANSTPSLDADVEKDAASSKPVQPEDDNLAVEESSTSEPSTPADDPASESELDQPSDTVKGEVAESANTEVTADPSDTSMQSAAATGAIDTSSGFQLKIAAVATTWLRVTPDDDSPKEYTLREGDQKEFQISSRVTLLIGNAGGITLTVNGQPYPIDGKKGDVVRMSIP